MMTAEWYNISELYKQRTLQELKQILSNSEMLENIYSTVKAEFTDYIGESCFQEVCPACNSKL
jgi:hypothetical protein